ncbi:Nbl1/borealin family, amino-terminal protein [Ceratobasidium theobromae]|uniref:Nbl1/borealin family, amino-terminal protein n=1 Tax=Ceratobasidium theobromae TaxID=1582974 RepID=A0A5N5QXB2_9AGAM|nr:Nbl1/borealin family, amino-terminal protein [Ceratobasidium theobromae]
MPLAVHNNILTSNTEVQNMENHTPAKMAAKTSSSTKVGRRFTEEEKAQLLENFDLEIADRVARMRANVADILGRFLIRQENEVTRIPRALRSLTVGEFADKYNGSIAACLQGMAQARLESTQDSDLAGGKRKWQGAQNTEVVADTEGSRAPKAARKAGPSSAVRRVAPHISRTPSTNRTLHSTANPTPSRPRLNATPLRKAPAVLRTGTGTAPASPFRTVPSTSAAAQGHHTARSVSQPVVPSGAAQPPTSATFAPTMPPSAPAYPRRPRKGEHLLSVNGSPLANPLDPDYDVLPDDQLELDGGKAVRSPKPKLNLSKQTPSIRIRPNYSRSAVSLWQQGAPIRHPSASSTSTLVSYDLPPSNSSTLNSHSGVPQSASGKLPSSSSTSHLNVPHTPPKIRRTASAVVMLPTTTGEVIELDPLSTSPGTVDALEGLTASTKKMAKEEMVKFVTEAVARWNVQI